jgi:hypothetical protein
MPACHYYGRSVAAPSHACLGNYGLWTDVKPATGLTDTQLSTMSQVVRAGAGAHAVGA